MKNLIAMLLSIICVIGLMAGCGAAPAPEAEPEILVEPSTSAVDWLNIDEENGIMTVDLPTVDDRYSWQMSFSDPAVAEMVTCTTEEGSGFVASFRGLADGKCEISFDYANGVSVAETRVVTVSVSEGKIIGFLSAYVTEVDGISEYAPDPALTKLIEENSIANVMADHIAMTKVSEVWTVEKGEEVWQSSAVDQFIMTNGRLWYDGQAYDEAGEIIYANTAYINDDAPGAVYIWMPDSVKAMEILPAEEYALYLESFAPMYLGHTLEETLLSVEEDAEYDNTLFVTEHSYSDIRVEREYFVETSTGLLTGMNEYGYDIATQELISVTRSNIIYDEPRDLGSRAAFEILFPEDACYLTLVINPGQPDEETQQFQVDKETIVAFISQHPYSLFYDYDCQQPMDQIDVNQNKLSVYAVVER